jgi:hypothetical protein
MVVQSGHTSVNWYNFCRGICEMTLFDGPQGLRIGGLHKIVAIETL